MSKKKEGSLKPGSTLGTYEIIRLIGKGGMGEVYEAYEPSLNRRVALKIIPRNLADKDPELVIRFDSEGKVLAQLNHPNVVIVHSLGQAENIHYLTMEYVDGVSLKEFIAESSFSLDKAIPIFQQIVAGVEALHNSGIIHRDMKPANIIYRRDGSIKIVDLGIAKVAEDTNFELTKAGEVVGSPLYMSPEVASGLEANPQSDLWGIGIILFEMLTGQNPFKEKTQTAILRKIKDSDLEFSRDLLKSCPYEFLKIIKKLCERDRTKRYKKTSEISRDLDAFAKKRSADLETRTVRLEQTNSASVIAKSAKFEDLDGEAKLPLWLILAAATVVIGVVFTLFINNKNTSSSVSEESAAQTAPSSSFKLISPEDQKTIWQDKNQTTVTFEWSIDAKPIEYFLQVSMDAQFQQLLLSQKNPLHPFKASQLPQEKRYYWRILFIDRQGNQKTSPTSEFVLSGKQAPTPIYPFPNARVLSDDPSSSSATNSIRFEWQSKITVDRYRTQISRDFAFSDVVYDQTVNTSSLKGILLPLGNYYWRVRAVGDSVLSDFWSQPVAFAVFNNSSAKPKPEPVVAYQDKKPTLPSFVPSVPKQNAAQKTKLGAPLLKKQKVTTVLEFLKGPRNPASLNPLSVPVLSWASVKNSRSYTVQIAQDESFSQVVDEQEVPKTFYQWKSVMPGAYYWRVNARNESGTSNFSRVGTISSFFTAPDIKVQSSASLDNDTGAVNVKWKSNSGSNTFILKVSPSSSFSSGTRAFQANGDNFDLGIDSPGKLFIKVAALNDRGEIISDYSRTASLLVGRASSLAVPSVNSPSDGATVVEFAGITPVAFAWETVKNATSYEIDFATDRGFTKSLNREVSKDTQFVLKKKLPNSKVYWRMRAKKSNTSSPWTETRALDVQAEGT
ncbi:MAG: serine/threonine-protein kinase [Pseudomonadota bacterium]|nr:serine/threonine-protein kinase [Pseudomonadota bacterium]